MPSFTSRFHDTIHTLRIGAANLLFPPSCPICNAATDAGATLCPACFNAMHMISAPACERCGHPFEYDMGWADMPCPSCTASPPLYDEAKAIWQYDTYSAKLVQKLKYADHTHLAPYLATIMRGQGAALIEKAEILAPVPLHYRRLIHRRYNQSMLLASHMHRQTVPSITLIPHLLKRARHTPPQASLSQQARQRNMQNAFCIPPKYIEMIQGARILLVDDVITTGATVNACTASLKKAGCCVGGSTHPCEAGAGG